MALFKKDYADGYDFDVIIVGSGVAGAIAAWKLATYDDYRILILEAGDNGINEGQRVEFHHAMDRQGNRGDMFAPYLEVASRIMVPSPEKAAAPKPAPGQPFAEKYYDYAATPDTFRAGYTRLVGGYVGVARKLSTLPAHRLPIEENLRRGTRLADRLRRFGRLLC